MAKKMKIPIRGVVLAGGKSTRMGKDKGLLIYHRKPQRIHCFELLDSLGLASVHMSCRQDQVADLKDYHPIPDKAGKAGPMFILSNLLELNPDSAWLLLPCDVPLMDKGSLEFLIKARNPEYIATAFKSPVDGKPEPLLAIWEPVAGAHIRAYISQKIYSPRRLLLENKPKLIEAKNPDAFLNANSPEEKARIHRLINKRNS